MTARSRKRRQKNASIKREKNKVKELVRLRKTLGLPELMDTDTVQVVDNVNEINKKKEKKLEEKLIEEEFIAEKTNQDNGKNIAVVNENTKKKHVYNTKTMRDQFGSYPSWYRAKKMKRKINKRKISHKSNFWTSTYMPL